MAIRTFEALSHLGKTMERCEGGKSKDTAFAEDLFNQRSDCGNNDVQFVVRSLLAVPERHVSCQPQGLLWEANVCSVLLLRWTCEVDFGLTWFHRAIDLESPTLNVVEQIVPGRTDVFVRLVVMKFGRLENHVFVRRNFLAAMCLLLLQLLQEFCFSVFVLRNFFASLCLLLLQPLPEICFLMSVRIEFLAPLCLLLLQLAQEICLLPL